MANALCLTSFNSFNSPNKPGLPIASESPTIRLAHSVFLNVGSPNFTTIKAKAADSDQSKKVQVRSIVCPDCEGNGALLCSQCKGNGVNSVDHFNGQFKAGGLCWLCRGKRDILCGNCNGAGFLGGFMSSMDE